MSIIPNLSGSIGVNYFYLLDQHENYYKLKKKLNDRKNSFRLFKTNILINYQTVHD